MAGARRDSPHRFLLGGRDLEMLAIRELLEARGERFADKGLAWGARASDYRGEIQAALAVGQTPVLVELTWDLPIDPARVVLVDHHGDRAGADQPTALEQVFSLLGLPRERWTRWHELVAANDRAYVPGLLAIGASRDEVARVRAADRAAQGVTPEDEAEAERAVGAALRFFGGRLTVVRLAHGRTSAVCDRLDGAQGGPGFENLLVVSPAEANFFGDGRLVRSLDQAFPGGWYGGALPERGFWGHAGPPPGVEEHLRGALANGGAGAT